MKSYITIKLFATLKKYLPASADNHPIESGASVRELINELRIEASQAKLIFINGRKADLNSVLKDGDRLGVFPPVGGG